MTFSFFSKLRGGGAEIRGHQMASLIRGKFNPDAGYEGDTCVHVLGCTPRDGVDPARCYHDVMDCGLAKISRVDRFPGGIIATSKSQYGVLRKEFPRRELHMIPQHHCNFDRERREDRPVLRVGCIGGDAAVQWPHWSVERMLKEIGLEWHFEVHYHTRRRVVAFYRTIDIQLCFRPTHPRGILNHLNTLKLANAGSFGIPTVALPEPAYSEEWPDACVFGDGMYDIMLKIKSLKENPQLYAECSNRASLRAEEYHYENILPLYRALPGAV